MRNDIDNALSRREFGAASMAAGVVATAGAAQAGEATVQRAVQIKTPDGVTDAVLAAPKSGGPRPGVIWYPDALGLRPAMLEMAARLASHGYAVLVVNQFYRLRPAPVWPADLNFADPDQRAALMKAMASLSHDMLTHDAKAFVAFIDQQPEVSKTAKLGAVGLCMGGAMTIRAAAAAPDRVGAGVSFHGGGLVSDDPDSPHKLVAATKAAYHIGVAADDDEKQPDAKVKMQAALEAAGRPFTQEVYSAKHGWTVPDSPVYNEAQAERGWVAMLATYKQALG